MAVCKRKGSPICVGIDPVLERLPKAVTGADPVERIKRWTLGVLQAVAPLVPVVKFQSACYERYGWRGVQACEELVVSAKAMGLIVILDAKRGDIGASSEHYAAGLLAGGQAADALTVNCYLGVDGLQPFIDVAARNGKGLFVLVRTSNPGGDALQGQKLADGRTVAESVAGIMAAAGSRYVGSSGYSLLGAVVGATKPADAARLRQLMPQQVFLVPGFGAQGGSADDVRACFKPDGTGALITASRSILYAYEKDTVGVWTEAIERATLQMKREIAGILNGGSAGGR